MKQQTVQKQLNIKSYKRLYGLLAGEHKSFLSGNGLDFRELREYSTNDDIRRMNWKVTAKRGEPCINLFNEDKKLNIVLVYLVSGGIYFGSVRSKKEVMDEIFANLSYAAFLKKDSVSTLFFSEKEEYYRGNSTNKSVLLRDFFELESLEILGKEIDFKLLEDCLLQRVKRKSLFFFVGDFLEMPDFRVLSAKHEIYCAVVRDRYEEDISYFGNCSIVDANTKTSSKFYGNHSVIKEYQKLIESHDRVLFDRFRKLKIKAKKVYTNDNIIPILASLVKDR